MAPRIALYCSHKNLRISYPHVFRMIPMAVIHVDSRRTYFLMNGFQEGQKERSGAFHAEVPVVKHTLGPDRYVVGVVSPMPPAKHMSHIIGAQ